MSERLQETAGERERERERETETERERERERERASPLSVFPPHLPPCIPGRCGSRAWPEASCGRSAAVSCSQLTSRLRDSAGCVTWLQYPAMRLHIPQECCTEDAPAHKGVSIPWRQGRAGISVRQHSARPWPGLPAAAPARAAARRLVKPTSESAVARIHTHSGLIEWSMEQVLDSPDRTVWRTACCCLLEFARFALDRASPIHGWAGGRMGHGFC